MLPRADLAGSRPITYAEAPTPVTGGTDARQEVFHRLSQIQLGQQLQAAVLQRMDDGSFLVKVADTAARMNLPVGTKVGDTITLTLLEKAPRPTFAIGQEVVKAGGDSTLLSPAGRLIDRLLQAAQQGNTSAAVVGKLPVLPGATTDTQQVASALHGTVDASGLFYESHLAQWAEGSRSRAELMREPQAQQSTPAKGVNGAEGALLRHLVQQWVDQGRPLADLAKELGARAGQGLQITADDLMRLLPNANSDGMLPQVNSHASQLINSQLSTLENQRFVWQGELWPGQKMEWEVSRDAPEREQTAPEQQSWQSVVKFDLPTLGQVSATIHLSGDRVRVTVATGSEQTAAALRNQGGKLANALDAAGSPLDSLIVKQNGSE